jgi:hypothetical protein
MKEVTLIYKKEIGIHEQKIVCESYEYKDGLITLTMVTQVNELNYETPFIMYIPIDNLINFTIQYN